MGINGLFPSLKQRRITGKWNRTNFKDSKRATALCGDANNAKTSIEDELDEMEKDLTVDLAADLDDTDSESEELVEIKNVRTNNSDSHSDEIASNEIVDCTDLYIDFNSILYTVVSTIEDDINFLLYSMILHCLYDRELDPKARVILEEIKYEFDPFDLTECLKYHDKSDGDTSNEHDSDDTDSDSNTAINISTFEKRKLCTKSRLKNFMDHCSSLVSEQYVWRLIKKYLTHVMDDLVTGQNVRRIFLSIDGIPNMAKIEEQKRRRNMTYISSGLRRNIYRTHRDSPNFTHKSSRRSKRRTISSKINKVRGFDSSNLFTRHSKRLSPERDMFETFKYVFDRSQITPINKFMDRIVQYLESPSFKTCMFEQYGELNEIKVSSHRSANEGEKKIMADIMDRLPEEENIVIFSPDSDIIILAVLIRNMMNRAIELESRKIRPLNIDVVRYNFYNGEYTTISANDLCHDIYNYVKCRTNLSLSENRVTNDICFIFTLFGNDYIPRIESIDVSNNIELLLDSYVKVIEKSHTARSFGTYIVYHSKDSYRINYRAFSNYIRILAEVESILFKERYIKNTYKNYRWIKSIFKKEIGTKILFPDLIRYLELTNNIAQSVEIINREYKLGRSIESLVSEYADRIIEELEQSIEISDHKVRVGRHPSKEDRVSLLNGHLNLVVYFEELSSPDQDDSTKITPVQRLRKILTNLFDRTDSLLFKLVLLNHKHDVRDPYHQRLIRSKFVHPEMKITEYDEHLYMMERCFGPYTDLLRTDIKMGEFKIYSKNRYRYQTTRAKDEATSYYATCFNREFPRGTEVDIDKICREYVEGLFWIFNFNMNCNSRSLNTSYKSIWCYKYPMAPLIFNISQYLHRIIRTNKKELNKIFHDVSTSYFVDSDRYITPLEYYLFVNPPQRVNPKVVGTELHSDFTMIQNVTDDRFHLDRVVSNIWSGRKNLVFCRDRYLKRGALLGVSHISLDDWRKLLKVNGLVLNNYSLPDQSPILPSVEKSRHLERSDSDQSVVSRNG